MGRLGHLSPVPPGVVLKGRWADMSREQDPPGEKGKPRPLEDELRWMGLVPTEVTGKRETKDRPPGVKGTPICILPS